MLWTCPTLYSGSSLFVDLYIVHEVVSYNRSILFHHHRRGYQYIISFRDVYVEYYLIRLLLIDHVLIFYLSVLWTPACGGFVSADDFTIWDNGIVSLNMIILIG